MLISDWSSDVCSSDLIGLEAHSSIIAGLESWLCRQPELGDRCHIVDVAVPKTGFSADTFLIDLEGCATGVMGKRALVVRIERQIGRAHVGTPVTNAHLVCRLLLERNKYKSPSPQHTSQ